MYKIALIDDHEIVLNALENELSYSEELIISYKSRTGHDFIDFLKSNPIDLLILDLNMPNEDGIQKAKKILKQFPSLKIIILSTFYSDVIKRLVLSIGVYKILPKTILVKNLIEEIKDVLRQENPELQEETTQMLTKRQYEILKYLAEGKTAKEIGDKLFISEHTVRAHKVDMMEKFGIENPIELIKFAVQTGLIS